MPFQNSSRHLHSFFTTSNTPSPVSTALIASNILSGVGEVNTSPQTAASSIPSATKPACAGSCPLPPPETIATPCSFLSFFYNNCISNQI